MELPKGKAPEHLCMNPDHATRYAVIRENGEFYCSMCNARIGSVGHGSPEKTEPT